MKKFVVVIFLLLCTATSIYGQKTRYGQEPPYAKKGVDYPIKVHISGTHIRKDCNEHWYQRNARSNGDVICIDVVYADAIVNGMKLEVMGDWSYSNYQHSLLPGDYNARLLKADHQKDESPIHQVYELVLPDRHVWRCTVTGISE
ncbi:MAG: hypothetical protein WCA89_13430 [Terracidiphilus sp.]|jgi:hypothetical protein